MKKYSFILLAVVLAGSLQIANAQKAPYEMMVEGVKVIVQPSGNEIVEIQTIIKGGVQNYPAAKMGIEQTAVTALTECGTLKHDKNSFKNELDKVSAEVGAYANKDYATIRMNCIKTDFDTVWPLYVEALTEPKFDAADFTRLKQNAISSLKRSQSSPDKNIDDMADKTAFAGRPYASDPQGTPEIIEKLTPEETKAYYNSVFTKSRMVIVIVGELDKAVIEKNVKAMLANVKTGSPFQLKKDVFRIYKNTFTAEAKDVATNYVEGITSGPEAGAPDFNAFNVAMRIFADRHFLDIRTNNGLSYAPQSWFAAGATSVAKFAVSTTMPNKYIEVFDKLVDKTKNQGFTAEELADMKVTYLTTIASRNEANNSQAAALATNEVLFNNWKRAVNNINDVKKLTLDQVNTAFRNYISNTSWVYQGDPKKVTPILFINGTLHKPDNPVGY